jgi:uncharacterized membrane protein YukC
MVLDVLDVYLMKTVALIVKLFVINVAKSKQSNILTSQQKYYNYTYCQNVTTEAKYGSGNWPMSNCLEPGTGH